MNLEILAPIRGSYEEEYNTSGKFRHCHFRDRKPSGLGLRCAAGWPAHRPACQPGDCPAAGCTARSSASAALYGSVRAVLFLITVAGVISPISLPGLHLVLIPAVVGLSFTGVFNQEAENTPNH